MESRSFLFCGSIFWSFETRGKIEKWKKIPKVDETVKNIPGFKRLPKWTKFQLFNCGKKLARVAHSAFWSRDIVPKKQWKLSSFPGWMTLDIMIPKEFSLSRKPRYIALSRINGATRTCRYNDTSFNLFWKRVGKAVLIQIRWRFQTVCHVWPFLGKIIQFDYIIHHFSPSLKPEASVSFRKVSFIKKH